MDQIPDRETALALLRKYDSTPSFDKAARLLEDLGKVELEAWFVHPATQSLIASLDGDLCDVQTGLLGGGYYDSHSVDYTAQAFSKAQGKSEALFMVLERMREMRNLRQEESDES